jgi:hypothetical protein
LEGAWRPLLAAVSWLLCPVNADERNVFSASNMLELRLAGYHGKGDELTIAEANMHPVSY